MVASPIGSLRLQRRSAGWPSLATPLDLPDLKIVPVSSLHPHERFDASRAEPLVTRLRADGVLKNPPIVLPLGKRAESYVVLDGANRTEAFRAMSLPHVLVQVVHPGDNSVRLETWNHLLRCVSVSALVGDPAACTCGVGWIRINSDSARDSPKGMTDLCMATSIA